MSEKYGIRENETDNFWIRNLYLGRDQTVELDEIQSSNIHFDVEDKKGTRKFILSSQTANGIIIQLLDALGKMEGCEEFLSSKMICDKHHDWRSKIELVFKYDKPKPKPTNWCLFEKLCGWSQCEVTHKKLEGKQWCHFEKYIADKKQVVVRTHITEKVTMGMGGEEHSWDSEKEVKLTIPVKKVFQVKRQCPTCRGSGKVFALRQYFTCGECNGSGRVIVEPQDYYKKVTAEVK